MVCSLYIIYYILLWYRGGSPLTRISNGIFRRISNRTPLQMTQQFDSMNRLDKFNFLNFFYYLNLYQKKKCFSQLISAVKCNPDPTVIKILAALNAGFDCASEVNYYDFYCDYIFSLSNLKKICIILSNQEDSLLYFKLSILIIIF